MMTEWSITSSTGTRGLTCAASPPESVQRVAHSRQVHHRRHAGEVLHQHAFGGEGDLVGAVAGTLAVRLGIGAPGRDRGDVVGRDVRTVLVAQQVLEEHLDGVGEPRDVIALSQCRCVEAEDLVASPGDVEAGAGPEGVGVGCEWGVRAHGPILP